MAGIRLDVDKPSRLHLLVVVRRFFVRKVNRGIWIRVSPGWARYVWYQSTILDCNVSGTYIRSLWVTISVSSNVVVEYSLGFLRISLRSLLSFFCSR